MSGVSRLADTFPNLVPKGTPCYTFWKQGLELNIDRAQGVKVTQKQANSFLLVRSELTQGRACSSVHAF